MFKTIRIAEEAALCMVALFGVDSFVVTRVPGCSIIIVEKNMNDHSKRRTLKMERGDMLDIDNIDTADIVMLETDVPQEVQPKMCRLLHNLKVGAHILTYLDLRKIWPDSSFPFRQVSINRSVADRFPTSWSVQRGHHFYLWKIVSPGEILDSDNMESLVIDDFSEITESSCRGHHYYGNPGASPRPDFFRSGRCRTTARNSTAIPVNALAGSKQFSSKPVANFFRKIFTGSKKKGSDHARQKTDGEGNTFKSACFPTFFGSRILRNVLKISEVRLG